MSIREWWKEQMYGWGWISTKEAAYEKASLATKKQLEVVMAQREVEKAQATVKKIAEQSKIMLAERDLLSVQVAKQRRVIAEYEELMAQGRLQRAPGARMLGIKLEEARRGGESLADFKARLALLIGSALLNEKLVGFLPHEEEQGGTGFFAGISLAPQNQWIELRLDVFPPEVQYRDWASAIEDIRQEGQSRTQRTSPVPDLRKAIDDLEKE